MKIFTTERLLIRPFEEGDTEQYFINVDSDKKTNAFSKTKAFCEISQTKEHIKTLMQTNLKNDNGNFRHTWAIELKSTSEIIGNIVVVYEKSQNQVEIGYGIGSKWWGNEYVPEAVQEIFDYCFHDLKVESVGACYIIGNESSRRVMEKVGMEFVGVKTGEGITYFNPHMDLKIYKITKEKYFNSKKFIHR